MSPWTLLSLPLDPGEKFSRIPFTKWPAAADPASLPLRGHTFVKVKMGIDRSMLPWGPKLTSSLKLRGRNSRLRVKSGMKVPGSAWLPSSVAESGPGRGSRGWPWPTSHEAWSRLV